MIGIDGHSLGRILHTEIRDFLYLHSTSLTAALNGGKNYIKLLKIGKKLYLWTSGSVDIQKVVHQVPK